MATHFSILAWGIPWTEKPGWLQSTAGLWQAVMAGRQEDHELDLIVLSLGSLARTFHQLNPAESQWI